MTKPSFFAELKRRNVVRMAGLYLVGAWLATQVAGTVLPMLEAPGWVARTMLALLAIGFVPALVFAWVFEITPDGLKRESEIDRTQSVTPGTGRRMDRAIIVALVLALVVFAADRFVLAPKRLAEHDAALRASMAASPAPAGAATATSAANGAGVPVPIPTIEADPSIAVLPMLNMSDDKANEYFSDGISEELLNLLAKVPKLRVIARTSSFSFKGTNKPIGEIARALNVAALLEGSVRKSGDTVRITVQLIRAIDGTHLWSQTYDRRLDDIFKVQDEISGDVVKQLRVTLLGVPPKARSTLPEAYEAFLQAVRLAREQHADALRQSDALFERVLELDPNYVPAYVGIANNLIDANDIGVLSNADSSARARRAAEQALAIEPANAAAEAVLGKLDLARDLASAARHLQRALASDAGDPYVLFQAGELLSALARDDEGADVVRAAILRDPLNPTLHAALGGHLVRTGRHDAAIAALRVALDLSPGYDSARAILAMTLANKGDFAAAEAENERISSEVRRLIGRAMICPRLGRQKDADAAFAELIARYANDWSYNIAYAYAFGGNADAAFTWLEKAREYHDTGFSYIAASRWFDPVRKDPRWLPFLRSVNRAPEQLAKIEFKVTLPQSGQATP